MADIRRWPASILPACYFLVGRIPETRMKGLHILVETWSPGRDVPLRCVLVHGTWAPDAAWVQPGSYLTERLKELDPRGVALSKFLWTGRNVHDVEFAAARGGRRTIWHFRAPNVKSVDTRCATRATAFEAVWVGRLFFWREFHG